MQLIRSKAQPTEWKPYLLAWKKVKGETPPELSQPWDLADLKIDKKKASEITVKFIVELLRKCSFKQVNQVEDTDQIYNWILQKAVLNKKKDILQ